MSEPIGVGVIGMGWMGTIHSRAYRGLFDRFQDNDISARLVVCADEVEARAKQAQVRFDFLHRTTDWRQVVSDPEVELVVVATSNNTHLEMVRAAAAAGQHIFCEKPVGRSPQETASIHQAASEAGVLSAVGYNYRWVPVVGYARQLIREGRLGEITHFRGRFLVDYGSNPQGVLSWRFQKEISGSGTLGDIMSHLVDMAHMLVGRIGRVVSHQKTFIADRPLTTAGEGTHFSVGSDGPRGEVTNEDYVGALVQFGNGAPGTLEVCRVVKGHDCEFAFEIDGTKGAVKWNYERMNEIELRLPEAGEEYDGFTVVRAGPRHPQFVDFYPGPANSMGYEDLKMIEAYQFAKSIRAGQQHEPSFSDALAVAKVQEAMMRSWESESWEPVVEGR